MSRNALDRMKKQGSAKAKENRTTRKVEKNKEYGKSGLSQSDLAYVNGNYKKSASNKAYGYRNAIKKGEIVRGTDSDWLSDGNIYRTTTVKDDTSWKNPTNKKGKEKYAILSSSKWNRAKTFDDQLNFNKLDGLKVAKANQRKGKHINNAIEWGKGLLKDTVVDFGVDAVKTLGAIGSYTAAGLSGLAEDSGNLVKAISDPNRSYKDYSRGRSNLKENIKSNTQALKETGWGEDFSTYLHGAKKRADEETIRLLKEDGRHKDAKEYQKKIEKEKSASTRALNATGFVMDILAPSTIEDKITGVGKVLFKNTKKSFDDMVKGTAKLSTGIVPEETAKLMANSKKYAGVGKKTSNASNDVFYSGKKGTTAIDKKLDNEFVKKMDNIKDNIKNNPKTQNLGKYLDVIGDKPYSGVQKSIDGRTLNKKYTQTKNGYVPRRINDNVEEVINNRVSGQYSMFGKDGSMDAYINNIQNPNARYERVLNRYTNDIDGLINKIDNMSEHNANAMYDYLAKNKPDVYKQVVKASDDIEDVIEGSARRTEHITKQKSLDDERYFNTPNINVTPKSSPEELFKKKQLQSKNYNLLKEIMNPKFVDNVGNIKEREAMFRGGMKNFAQKVSELSGSNLEEVGVKLKNAKYLLDSGKLTTHDTSKMLNELFFDGKDVVRKNIKPKHASQVLEYADDLIIKQANGVLEEYDSLGNLLELGEGARKIASSTTDYRYDEKMSNLASHFKVKNKSELTSRYKELKDKKLKTPLSMDEFYEYKELGDKITKWDDEYKKVKYMSDEYDDYAKNTYGKRDELQGYKDAVEEFVHNEPSKPSNYYGHEKYQKELYGDNEVVIPKRTTSEIKAINKKVVKIREALNLPETKAVNVKLVKGQKLSDLPPVRENLAHLKKTIQKEIRYVFENPEKYSHFEDGFKQIKQGYVNTLRAYGVPDDKYFHKVVALQNELKGRMNEILKGGSENTPLLKMELQKLASKVDNTFDELGNEVLDKIDDININKTPLDNIAKNTDEYVDDFERVIEQENIKHSEELRRKMEESKNTPKKRAEINPITEQKIKEYEKRLKLPVAQTLDELEFNIPGVDEDGVITSLSNSKLPSFEDFKKSLNKNSNSKLPYEDEKLYGVYKSWLNSWKKGLTVYNPGWHVQNFFQNKGQNFLALGMDAFKPQTEAKNVLKQINGEIAKDVNIFDRKNLKSYSSDEIAKFAQELGVVDGLSEDIKNARGVFPKFESWLDNTSLMKNLGKNEQTARLHHFMEQLKRGKTPEQARDSVNKYLFDYSNKSSLDKVMGDFVDPFWTFHKSNANLLLNSSLEHPNKLNSIIRAKNGLENNIDDKEMQNESSKYGKIQMPGKSIKDSVNGDTYNYLYSENMMPDLENAFALDDEALENKLNPIVRMLMQQSRGEGNFGNKIVDVKDGEKLGWDEISKKDRLDEIIQDLNPIMPNLFKTIKKQNERYKKYEDGKQSEEVTDKQVFYDWLNYITGNKGNYYRNTDF